MYHIPAMVYVYDREVLAPEEILEKFHTLIPKKKNDMMSTLQQILQKGRQETLKKLVGQGILTQKQAEEALKDH